MPLWFPLRGWRPRHSHVFVVVGLVAALTLSAPAYASSRGTVTRLGRNPSGKLLGIVRSRTPADRAASASAPSPLVYHGGPVQHSSAVYAILWIPSSYALPSGYEATIARYFRDVAHDSAHPSNVYASDTQYFDVAHGAKRFASYSVQYQSLIVDTHPVPGNGCVNYLIADGSTSKNCLTDAQIENEVGAVVAAHHLPTGLTAEYFLFTPKGLASCFNASALATGGCYDPSGFSGYCAYHSSMTTTAGVVLYANMAYAALTGCSSGQSPNGNPADSVLNVASHEHNETITDPLGTAWFDGSGNENGDKCVFTFGAPLGANGRGEYNQVINGHDYWLQQEWSNRANGCVQRNTYPQPTASFKSSPAAPVHGTTVTFTSTAHDSDDTTFSYHWTFSNATVSTLANPKHIFTAKGPNKVALIVSDPHGDQVKVVRTVNVS